MVNELGFSHDRRGVGRAVVSRLDTCRQTGYKGRLAIAEILPFTQPIKELTVRGATSGEIKLKGRELGMSTLRDAGWNRVKSGITTVEEVLRVTADTDLVYE